MRRREFITVFGGAAATLPLAARAQQPERLRRVGLVLGYSEGDAEGQASAAAFRQKLQELGWTEDRNIRIDTRWASSDPNKARTFAKELVGMTPDVIVSSSNLVTEIVQQETRNTGRIRVRRRSSRQWLRHKCGASRRKPHWISGF